MLEARFNVKPVRTAADLEVMVRLFNECASSVGVDLSYQDFATELASLLGKRWGNYFSRAIGMKSR
jgi:hypothetical protein